MRCFPEQPDKNRVDSSQAACIRLVALKLLSVGAAARLSIKPELRWALAWLETSDSWCMVA